MNKFLIFGIILTIVVLGVAFKMNADTKSQVKVGDITSVNPPTSNWEWSDKVDPMTDVEKKYLYNKAVNVETGNKVDAGIFIGCSPLGGFTVAFTATNPIKTRSFDKYGAIGEYEIRFDDKSAETSTGALASMNQSIQISNSHIDMLANSKSTLVRITTASDQYQTYRMDTSNGNQELEKLRQHCLTIK